MICRVYDMNGFGYSAMHMPVLWALVTFVQQLSEYEEKHMQCLRLLMQIPGHEMKRPQHDD